MARASDFLTVGTVSYIPQAVATLRSVRRHSTHSSFYFFAVDATAETVADLRRILGTDDPWIHVFGPYDLGPWRDVFLEAFKYYNHIEMCCLAKYVGVAHVLGDQETEGICVYADSDILFLGDVSEIFDEMGQSAVFLTPHQLGPGRDDIEHDHLLHGWLNAGFFIFRRGHPDCRGMLDWLINRISRRGYFAPEYGLSCDQTWLSALPIIYHGLTSMSRHPGLNVAYWNLLERNLTDSGSAILVNGVPLLFFHFSGFDRTCGTRLSRHSDLLVPPGTALEEVCRLYKSELDVTASLQTKVAGLKTLPCSKADLLERIRVGSMRNGVNIAAPTTRLGLFSRVGQKIDSILRQTLTWHDR